MRDYPPLHSPEAFADYYRKFVEGVRVEPVVVIPAKTVIENLKEHKAHFDTYKLALEEFLTTHQKATYFMLGGKHRSAAATVLGLKIPCLVVSGEDDVDNIHALMAAGRLTGEPSVGENFAETLSELDDHYFRNNAFWSMDEKTKAMIDRGDISF